MVTQLSPPPVKSRGRPRGSRISRPIEGFDLETGETKCRFANVAEAVEQGYIHGCVHLQLPARPPSHTRGFRVATRRSLPYLSAALGASRARRGDRPARG